MRETGGKAGRPESGQGHRGDAFDQLHTHKRRREKGSGMEGAMGSLWNGDRV